MVCVCNFECMVGAEKVVAVLGYFPSFHDAEVIQFSIERALPLGDEENIARLVVHVRNYKTVGEGTAQYEQVLTQSVLIEFCFHGAQDIELSEFNHQNVINGISIREIQKSSSVLWVDIESIWGFGGTLTCSSVEISSVKVLCL